MAITPMSVRDGNSAAKSLAALQDAAGNNVPMQSLDSSKATYRFAASGAIPQPTAAVTLLHIQGSATKTVRVKRIAVAGVATAAGSFPYTLQRTSALGAGGTIVSPTAAKNDKESAAASAVVSHNTTTLKAAGVAVGGPLSAGRMLCSIVTLPTTGPVQHQQIFPEFGAPIGQALVLRGVADFIELQNVNAGNLPAGTALDYVVELEEDAS